MEDTSWIKPQLDSLFAGRVADIYLQGAIDDKISMFGSKLSRLVHYPLYNAGCVLKCK